MRSEPGEKWCNDSPDKVGRCQHNWDNKENENNSYNETSVWWGWRCLTWTPRRRWKKIYDTQKLDRSEARKTWWKCIPRFLPHRHLCYQGHNDPLGPSDRQQSTYIFPVHRHTPEIPVITSRGDCEVDELISCSSCFLVGLFFFFSVIWFFHFFFGLFVWLIFYSVFFLLFQSLSTPRRFV